MGKVSKPPAGGLSPAKLGLIIVLSIVLLTVIVSQFGGSSGSSGAALVRRKPIDEEQAESPTVAESSPVNTKPALSWPTFTVTDVVSHNPFQLPEKLREPSSESQAGQGGEEETIEPPEVREMRRRRQDLIASLRERGVDMIVMTPQGSVARVGSMSFRVGDVVEGLRVAKISEAGIVFAKHDGAERQ